MRTDILRSVHQGIEARREHRGQKSPLEILIESIEEVLITFEGCESLLSIEPNPFNTDPSYRFEPESDYGHDIRLLKSQLRSLQQILASLSADA